MSNAFNNIECEKAFLGSLFLDNKILDNLSPAVKPDVFCDIKHQIVFTAITRLYSEGNAADILSVPNTLRQAGQLENAGGVAYVASLTDQVPSTANVKYYVEQIIECYKNRELRNYIIGFKEKLGTETPEAIIRDLSEKIYKIETLNTGSNIKKMPQVMENLKTEVDYNVKHWNEERGVRLGFQTVDRMTCGVQPTDMIVIGARPSIGKTAIAVNMMDNVLSKGKAVGFISAEMSSRLIGIRLVSQRSGVSNLKFRTGIMSTEQHSSINNTADEYKTMKLYIDDTPNINLNAMISTCRHFKNHYNVEIIFIDYIGLISVEAPGQHWEKISLVSKTIKKLTNELKVPIVVLCQLTRDAEGNEPNLANLSGSGSIANDADIVMLLDGERDKSTLDNPIQVLERTMLITKNRNGPTGKVYLNFDKRLTKFTEDPDQAGREAAANSKEK